MSPVQRMIPFKMLQDVSEMVAIQPRKSKVHVAFSVGGKDWMSGFRRVLFLFTQLDKFSFSRFRL